MKTSIQKALIGAFSSVLTAAISIPAAITLNNQQYQSNSNSMTINIDGEKAVVTAEKYEELIRENEAMSREIESLEEQLEETKANSDSDKQDNREESTENSSSLQSEKTRLKSLALVDSVYYELLEPLTDSCGNLYETGYQFDASNNAYAVYGLQGEYNSFSGMIVCAEQTGSGADMSLMVYKDDELIDTIRDIDKQMETRKIGPYDIGGARRLTIKTSNNGDYPNGWCYLVNAFVE